MLGALLPTVTLLIALPLSVYGNLTPTLERRDSTTFQDVCIEIESKISDASGVFYRGNPTYGRDIFHWAKSSAEFSACTVEPGTTADVGEILKILGRTRTPFGIKSGGHTGNPGFSSSEGVLIAMYRFDKVKYDSVTGEAEIGTGLNFDQVYDALAPHDVSVAGARVTGIGVGGFVLGGGYSWKTNEHGLAVDTVTAFELVKPDGDVVTVTQLSDPKLFFGLKGGFNNFGVVTHLTMKTYPQTSIWAGLVTYPYSLEPEISAAVTKFSSTNMNKKANIITGYNCVLTGAPIISQLFYYDGPKPQEDPFKDFPGLKRGLQERSLYNFIRSTGSNTTQGARGAFSTVPLLRNSPAILEATQKELNHTCKTLGSRSVFISYNIEPFMPTILGHNKERTAYPPTRDKTYLPYYIYYAWLSEENDSVMIDALKASMERIRDAAEADGQDIEDAPLYPNYALFDTPVEKMYKNNVGELKELKRRIDPFNVMGLAGGFKF